MTKRATFFFPSCTVGVLNKLVVKSVQPKKIVPFFVVFCIRPSTVKCHFVITEEKVKCFNCGQWGVLFPSLVPPKNSLFCIYFYHLELADGLIHHVVPGLAPSTVNQNNTRNIFQILRTHLIQVLGLVSWEKNNCRFWVGDHLRSNFSCLMDFNSRS